MAAHAKPNHDYHLVNPSPWPFVGSVSAFVMAVGAVLWFHDITPPWILIAGFVGVLYTMYAWWSDVIKEGKAGDHTPVVMMHHRYGMILFIASEVMFFVAWFWAYFDGFFNQEAHEQYARIAALGTTWPPTGVELFNPWHLPLFNTLILLTSGTAVTWAHHALLHRDKRGLVWGLAITIALGVLFTCVQAIEYSEAGFLFGGEGANIYGATFFMATGFHGFHVLIGTIFLIVCLIRAMKDEFTPEHHLGFEFAAWYWHFVDVVWLFLFASIYVWGSWGVALSH
ncbi:MULTISPECIES: cytochrome c oxidase subunit 3 [unclassified Devosia]|jgi:cytochrome c oxidase subunit 3|uniref:cytochrome c oxidase subunit 3 n=1 Tax=unclassified Devosia TaxID=196773 RepID=UPI00086B905B|nr:MULTISPECIES: cytochrome c oxidase subunit 3 [unclassified Devosia]MBN9360485.1 cytochrome c oxidase subunit 3 [Devosia sp.]ODS94464.1 MAG: cytochrome B562 [Devosia sp. SCN 66-27]OJX22487.1 MAG: cytochrome c oxidase subunit 3 [Devosia sp. 66-14]